jgi:hypothetical protein
LQKEASLRPTVEEILEKMLNLKDLCHLVQLIYIGEKKKFLPEGVGKEVDWLG